nr:TetR/AcrR family transcriptional regulator C-terminal domain-containing protein [Spongiactinospora rosea]
MSLYRHVTGKDELVTQMADEVFGEAELPVPGPEGWRAKLEPVAHRQWKLSRRHLWLPRAVSFTRPLLVPNMMAHTEWTLRALDGLELPMETRIREALTLPALVHTVALSMAEEAEAEQETGMTLDGWRQLQRRRAGELLSTGQFPLLAMLPEETVSDLDGMFDYTLERHLDGFAVMLGGGLVSPPAPRRTRHPSGRVSPGTPSSAAVSCTARGRNGRRRRQRERCAPEQAASRSGQVGLVGEARRGCGGGHVAAGQAGDRVPQPSPSA